MSAREPAATRWDIVMMALGAGIFSGLQVGKAPPAIPFLRESLGLDLVAAGWVVSIYYAIGAISGVSVGLLSDRLGPRRLILTGIALLGIGSLIGGLAQTGAMLLAGRFVEGFGFVAVTVTAPKLIATAAQRQDHGFAFGIWGTYMPLGMTIAMLIAPPVIDAAGWRGLWLVTAAMVALFLIPLAWSLHPRRWPVRFCAGALDWSGVRATVSRRGPWLFGGCFTLYTLQWLAIMTWLPTFLIETQGRSAGGAALWGALVVFANVLGCLAAARLMHQGVPRALLIAIAYLVMGSAAAGLLGEATPGWLKIPLALAFSAVGGLLPAACIAGGAAHAPTPALVAMASGFVVQGAAIGSLLGPPVMASAVGALGGWQDAWWLMLLASGAGLMLVGTLLVAERRVLRHEGPAPLPRK